MKGRLLLITAGPQVQARTSLARPGQVPQAADSGDLNEGGETDKHYGHGVGAGGAA